MIYILVSGLLERTMAHLYETGRKRRVHLRGHDNIIKRLLIHACSLNLALLMRTLYKVGKQLVNRLPSGFLARCPGRRIQAWVVDPIGFQL